MSIASFSFAAALPTYTSTGSNGTVFAKNTIAAQGDVTINTNGAPASSGQATVVASDLTANGLNYTPQGVSVSGNEVTVIYGVSTNATAHQTLQADDQSAALTNGLPGSGITITPEGAQTNGNITTTAYEIALNGPANSGTVTQQTGYSVSNSGDGASLSLEGVSSLGDGLKVTYQLSDPTAPATQPSPASAPVHTGSSNQTGLPTSQKGLTTIGELLTSTSGLPFGSALTGSLSSQAAIPFSSATNLAGVLASVLSPNSSADADASFQVADFINTGSNTFPTAPSPAFASSNSSDTSSQNSASGQGNGPSAGVYTAFANVGASTIRGGNLNVVA